MAPASSKFTSSILPLIAVAALSACATPDPEAAVRDFGTLIATRTSDPIVWRTGGAEDAAVDARVQGLLSEPLTAEAAVAVALLNNRGQQARYAELGIAQADLVEAGLLENPMFEVMVRPSTESGTNLEFGLVQNFVSLLMRPARQKIAQAEYENVQLELAADLIAFTAEVRSAYFAHVGARNQREAVAAIASTARDAADLAKAFHTAGNITELELVEFQADAEEATVASMDAEQEVAATEIDLIELLGLPSTADWSLLARLPALPDQTLVTATLEDQALRERFDLQAMRAGLRAAADHLGLEQNFRLLDDMELGVSAEREPEGEWLIGPSLEFPLPIFDQGQGRVTHALLELRQLQDELVAKEASVRADVRRATTALTVNRQKAAHLLDILLPLKQRLTRLTLAEYNYMLTGAFEVLEAEQHENEVYREHLEALTDYWIARAELMAAVGGQLDRPQQAQTETDPNNTDAKILGDAS
ncbi:MAG: TolC family protein [Rhodospirillaceae bacterium]